MKMAAEQAELEEIAAWLEAHSSMARPRRTAMTLAPALAEKASFLAIDRRGQGVLAEKYIRSATILQACANALLCGTILASRL